MKRAFRIGAALLAVSMLVGYVSHARRQKNVVASSPKSSIANLLQADGARATWALEQRRVVPVVSNAPPLIPTGR